jgi:hypothetical protein
MQDLTTFYYQHIELDATVVAELQQYFLALTQGLTKRGVTNFRDTAAIAQACPAFTQWAEHKGLHLKLAAVHHTVANSDGLLHKDIGGLAVNLNLENCENTKTLMFRVEGQGRETRLPDGSLYITYDKDLCNCTVVAEYSLRTAIIINTQQPHQVTNSSNQRRLSLSLRFNEDIAHLLTVKD